MKSRLSRRLGVIGTGKMGSALVRGFVQSGLIQSNRIIASDVEKSALERLKKDLGIQTTADNALVAKSADMILMAVKPGSIRTVLQEIKGALTQNHLIISIAAGVPIKAMEDAVGSSHRIVRVMPNTPCLIGAGASAFSYNRKATDEDVALVKRMLESVGLAVELSEKQMDAVTGLSGSGPAFVFMVIEALADGGVRVGLPRPVALSLAAQTVLGAARMVIETKKHPAELKDQVASPGGTTVAGLAALERRGLRAALIEAVEAATRRSAELGGGESGGNKGT